MHLCYYNVLITQHSYNHNNISNVYNMLFRLCIYAILIISPYNILLTQLIKNNNNNNTLTK